MSKPNPLQGFFRKPKFSMTLPSRGNWYAKGSLDSTDGTVEVYAMTAADDTRFKTNEVLVSHMATYDLIRSCIPQVREPENMPVVDLDAALLSIRRASYGNDMDFKVLVPKTALERTVTLAIDQMVSSLPNVGELWDQELIIRDGDTAITLKLSPVNLRSMFSTTKQLFKQQQIAEKITRNDNTNDEKIEEMDQQLKTLGGISVNVVAESIRSITADDYFTDRPTDIRNFVSQLDLAYFNAIRQHLEAQKKLTAFPAVSCTATDDELIAGAPASWEAAIEFNLTNFFAR